MDSTLNIKNKRLVIPETGRLETATENYPDVPNGGLVIKVLTCGICHSDSHCYTDEIFSGFLPRVAGHETAGVIHKISDQCTDKSFSVGDRVIVFSWSACRNCQCCKTGNKLCQNTDDKVKDIYGINKDGGFQQYQAILHPTEALVKIPEDLPSELACLVPCSGLTAYNAVQQCKELIEVDIQLTGQTRVLVLGAGGLGLWAVEFVKSFYGEKAVVCAVDVFDDKLEQAKAAGADCCVRTCKEDDAASSAGKVIQAAGGKMSAAIDFVSIPSTTELGLNSLSPGGVLALVGLQSTKFPPLNLFQVITQNIRIQGICAGPIKYVSEIFQLISAKKVKGPPVTTVPFDEIGSVLKKMAAREYISGRYVAQIA